MSVSTLLTSVLTIFTDLLSAVVTSEIAQILSRFDLALKLALYTYKKKKKSKKAVTIQCVLPARPSEDGRCHWSVLEN